MLVNATVLLVTSLVQHFLQLPTNPTGCKGMHYPFTDAGHVLANNMLGYLLYKSEYIIDGAVEHFRAALERGIPFSYL